MRNSLARAVIVGLAALGLGGCDVGGVAWNDKPEAGPDLPPPRPDYGPDISVTFNLDVPPAPDTPPKTCVDTDGGQVCVTTICGNGIMEGTEECDDGNTVSGEGCTADCKLETDWACPTPGSPCISTVVCGDGRISGNEICDDHNTMAGDGCAADCSAVEPGWSCLTAGVRCQPKCGDSLKLGAEQCDDGNTDAADGCSATCMVETGYACPNAGEPCHKTVCGDGTKEGAESCDDGNTRPSDGCTMECKSEPVCTGSDGCTSPCGDGLKLPEEECDDGNRSSGDGCSSECKLETGWDCKETVQTTTTVPVTFRDMMPSTSTKTDPPPHPNFEVPSSTRGVVPDIVKDTLGDDRMPQYNPDVDTTQSMTTNAEDFNSWYHDSNYSKVVVDTLPLVEQADGTFVYDHSGTWDRTGRTWTTPAFFPLDDRGWATPPDGPEIEFLGTATDTDGLKHNFSFTSDVRYWFEYQGGENLSFTGDDDVWVFVNGKRAVDLGGVHIAQSGSVTLDDTAAATYNLTKGKIYEIVVFQAERRVTRSSYKLTLGRFNRTFTVCTPRCGDGVVNGTDSCDCGDGTAPVPATCSGPNDDASYGGCTTLCKYGGYCGDAIVNGPEACDDGVNTTRYGAITACAPGCHKPHYCGDNYLDGLFGEICDDGPANSDTVYGGCTTSCQIGPHCGDGIVNGSEECDDGVNTATYGATTGCGPGCLKPHYCGDKYVDSLFGEQCDNGVANGLSLCSEICKSIVP